jgi:hypothetical protein
MKTAIAATVFISMAAMNVVIDFVDRPPAVQETASGPR